MVAPFFHGGREAMLPAAWLTFIFFVFTNSSAFSQDRILLGSYDYWEAANLVVSLSSKMDAIVTSY